MNRISQLMAFVLGGAIAFALLQSLSACTDGDVQLDQVVRVFGMESLDSRAQRELQRYYETFAVYSNDPSDERQRDHYRDAFRLVQSHYVTEVDPAHLIDVSIKAVEDAGARPGSVAPRELVEISLDAMMAELDPHSSYLNPDEFRETNIITKGEFGGLGIEVTMEDEVIKVVSPIEGTPAMRAGIEAGDKITHLDGEPVKGKTLGDAVKLMRGLPGTRITLTIAREGIAPFDVAIVRAVIQVRSVRWYLDGDIGYVKVASFTEQVEDKLTEAMNDMFAQAATMPNAPLKGVVLDLRNNPGGLLDQSLFVSDAFLEGGEIISVRERNPRNDRVFLAEPGDLSRGLPMVVLINEGSASASEIVAVALKDHNRAVVMGRRSFGKGSVQTIQPLPVEGALRLTTARYFAPSGHTIQARGVAPDIVITRSTPETEEPEAGTIRREADLPGALSGDAMAERAVQATLPRENCPQAGPEGEDLELGCALAYLRAGTTAAFLKSLSVAAQAAQNEPAKPM